MASTSAESSFSLMKLAFTPEGDAQADESGRR
jgi:hypothetical protein